LKPAVSLCIPAWQAEAFIEETLGYARIQTYPNLRILVSVDACDDRTLELCHRVAATDSRIQVFSHRERLGWAGNVNFLLAQVDTPFFFFLWHDDIIAPHFIERLANGLIETPQAMSTYGNTRHFGAFSFITTGKSFVGPVVSRMIEVLTSPTLHGLVRCMMRREIIPMGLRIPQYEGRDYYENNTGYFLKILACGPVVHVPEAEYQRRNGSGSSVVDGWLRFPVDKALEGFRQNARVCMLIFRECIQSPTELEAVVYCLYLFLMERLRMFESRIPEGSLIQPNAVAAEFEGFQHKQVLHLFDESQRKGVVKAQARLFYYEGQYWCRKKDWQNAMKNLSAAAVLDPNHEPARKDIGSVLLAWGCPQGAHAIREMIEFEGERATDSL
jgi:glycosyltransferase involved in cell wall biosynthesis